MKIILIGKGGHTRTTQRINLRSNVRCNLDPVFFVGPLANEGIRIKFVPVTATGVRNPWQKRGHVKNHGSTLIKVLFFHGAAEWTFFVQIVMFVAYLKDGEIFIFLLGFVGRILVT